MERRRYSGVNSIAKKGKKEKKERHRENRSIGQKGGITCASESRNIVRNCEQKDALIAEQKRK